MFPIRRKVGGPGRRPHQLVTLDVSRRLRVAAKAGRAVEDARIGDVDSRTREARVPGVDIGCPAMQRQFRRCTEVDLRLPAPNAAGRSILISAALLRVVNEDLNAVLYRVERRDAHVQPIAQPALVADFIGIDLLGGDRLVEAQIVAARNCRRRRVGVWIGRDSRTCVDK